MLRIEKLPELAGPFLQTVFQEQRSPAAMIQQLDMDQGGTAKDLAKNRRLVMPSWTEDEELKELQQSYCRNKVRTTKYTFLSFIPKNLFEQLHRFANVYFVFLGALNFVPVVNAFQPEISIIPIVFVMSITAVKDLWEDQRRRKSDQKVNNCLCDVYDREHPGKVRVGLHSENLLLRSCTVRNTETVIGIVVYAGHETKAMQNNSGPRYKRSKLERRLNMDVLWSVALLLLMCFVAAVGHGVWLSGLQNTIFMIPDDTHPALAAFYMFWTMIIVLQVLIPISLYVSIEIVKLGQVYFIQNDLDLYNPVLDTGVQCRALNITEDLGQIQYLFSDKTGTLTENRMLFRRCTVAGTEYPHHENAISLEQYEAQGCGDADHSLTLRSRASRKSLSCKSLSCNRSSVSLNTLTAESDTHSVHDTLRRHTPGAFSSTMECAVVPDPQLQLKLSSLSSPMRSSLRQEAAEISHILDFFLALTVCNTVVVSSPTQPRHVVQMPVVRTPLRSLEEMKAMFQKLSLPRFPYSLNQSTDTPPSLTKKLFARGRSASYFPNSNPQTPIKTLQSPTTPSCTPSSTPSTPVTPALFSSGAWGEDMEDKQQAKDNSADESESDDEDEAEELLYEAESPDEAALVQAAKAYGCTLLGRSPEQVLVAVPGTGPLSIPLLHVLPFHSARKRMSVVVRHPLTGEVVVYTKGADNVIMELAEEGAAEDGFAREVMERTQKHLDQYAREGLRTLCVAKKVLEEQEYKAWLKRQEYAETSIENREELLLESAERLETNLTLLGATGIVDRLQEEVPETIEALQEAKIKVWVLTGDKQETAINIAFACKLLRPTDHILMANCDSKEACEAQFHELQREIRQVTNGGTSEDDCSSDCVLVIDGRTLDYALQKELQGPFLELACCCRSVICCRSTPLQKSQVVRLVRDQLKVMTLAIGDGANDVSMIQMADVGIGISGQEGMQAVMSSDFAISRFKFLRKLILVHGHWCYTRLANMILYFFYKNVMYVNLLFWYQFFCGFSGSTMTNSWVLIFFNLLFTSVPPLIYGVLDKDVSAETLLELPDLYKSGQNSQAYAGSDIGVFSFGSPINASALFIILLHQVIESRTVTWIHVTLLLFSVLFYYAFVLLFSITCVTCNSPTNPYGIETKMMSESLYYLVCGLTTVLALLPRILFRAFCNTVCPSDLVRAQKMERLSAQDYSSSLRQWRENKAAQKHVPQNLSVNADMPYLTDCIAEQGAVLS
ncbi:putative phospholipid-transporting ATPase VD [Anabarilius grahami]|uniref:Phospholipid-transporting ATPase n=1 Tax=Anabarilius grahami TaxID=495550 RepID=A0A3N0XX73_ANAGA|nr:putative phospholipid-transporting ATPase VD [Anabarilius grahami]